MEFPPHAVFRSFSSTSDPAQANHAVADKDLLSCGALVPRDPMSQIESDDSRRIRPAVCGPDESDQLTEPTLIPIDDRLLSKSLVGVGGENPFDDVFWTLLVMQPSTLEVPTEAAKKVSGTNQLISNPVGADRRNVADKLFSGGHFVLKSTSSQLGIRYLYPPACHRDDFVARPIELEVDLFCSAERTLPLKRRLLLLWSETSMFLFGTHKKPPGLLLILLSAECFGSNLK